MIGRRAIVGLSLLSALLFCALAAQGASAAESNNTTAYTCVPNGGAKDFSDAHCDNTVTPGTGTFGHVEITKNVSTTIEATNDKTASSTTASTPAVLKGTLLKAAAEITCTTVETTTENIAKTAKSTIENFGTGTQHKVKGQIITHFKTCTVQKPAKCTVTEPITVEAKYVGVDELNGAEKNMGLEFTPATGKVFTEITFGGGECALKGLTFPVEGGATATGTPGGNAKESGATLNFSSAKEMQTLKLGGNAAEFTGIFTTRMHSVAKNENPIALTTAT